MGSSFKHYLIQSAQGHIEGKVIFSIASFWFLIYILSLTNILPKRRRKKTTTVSTSYTVNGISSTPYTNNAFIMNASAMETETGIQDDSTIKHLSILYPFIYMLGTFMYLKPSMFVNYQPFLLYLSVICHILGHSLLLLIILLRFRNGATLHTVQYTVSLGHRGATFWWIHFIFVIALHILIYWLYWSADDFAIDDEYVALWIDSENKKGYPKHFALWVFTSINILGFIVLVIMASYKIYKFHVVAVNINLLAATTDTAALDWSERDFLHSVLRLVWLCGAAMFFTMIQLIAWTVAVSVPSGNENGEEKILESVWSWIFSITLFINMFCIWLSFPSSKARYQCICICYISCDKWCERLCLHCVSNSDAIKLHPSGSSTSNSSSASWMIRPPTTLQHQETLGIGILSPPSLHQLASVQNIDHYDRMAPYTPMTPKRSLPE